MTKTPKPPVQRALELVRDLHRVRAMNAADHQTNRMQTEGRAPDLVLLAPSRDEHELCIAALLEQIDITEEKIKLLIAGSPMTTEQQQALFDAIEAGEWPETKKPEQD